MFQPPLDRRRFLATAAASTAFLAMPHAVRADGPKSPLERRTIIDTHVHFYDPTRPEGVPWPPKGSPLDRTVLPANYRAERTPAPVTGVVVVEASERVEDNQWILDLAERDPFLVGFVGRLPLREERFAGLLSRFSKNPLYRGIRIRPEDVTAAIEDMAVERRLQLLIDGDQSIDVLGDAASLKQIATLAKRMPKLRIVIDHMANPAITAEPTDDGRAWRTSIARFDRLPNVACKVSGLVEAARRGVPKRGENASGPSPTDLAYYAPTLDHLYDVFGEDRVIYGSNWPVCEMGGSLYDVQKLATEYFESKGDKVQQKYLADNARVIYKWIERKP